MLQQTLSQTQTQRQEQQLTHQQIQGLELLQAATQELQQKINAELEANPTLELVGLGNEALAGNPLAEGEPLLPVHSDAAAAALEHDEALNDVAVVGDTWHDYIPEAAGRGRRTPEDDERRQFFFDSLEYRVTLQEFLLEQLRQADGLPAGFRRLCEEIIGSIDDSGYLRTHLADIAIACNVDIEEAARALKLIQSFEPPGIGARDLRECLLLQLERDGRRNSLAWQVVKRHLEDVGRNQIPKVLRELCVSATEFQDALAEIRRLQPFPGSQVCPPDTEYVAPEVTIEKDEDGRWQVTSHDENLPQLRVAPRYLEMLENPDTPAEVKSYIRQKIASSRALMRALDQRRSTIEEIARILLVRQKDFFDNGAEFLRPLTMGAVADEIGVHETTVSRAIANKYMRTPHGLLPFRHFFCSGYEAANGEMLSSLSIKQRIQEMIRGEDPKHPLSDDKLTKELAAQGLQVARRTVAKYREELGIPASNLRRGY